MKIKYMKIIGISVLAIALITGVASAIPAVSNEGYEVTSFALQPTSLNWDLTKNTKADPNSSWTVEIGYPYINLFVTNTGVKSFRVEVKHKTKGTIIFDKTVTADGIGQSFINNDKDPLVPSGAYTVTIYGGNNIPKGTIVLKASDAPY